MITSNFEITFSLYFQLTLFRSPVLSCQKIRILRIFSWRWENFWWEFSISRRYLLLITLSIIIILYCYYWKLILSYFSMYTCRRCLLNWIPAILKFDNIKFICAERKILNSNKIEFSVFLGMSEKSIIYLWQPPVKPLTLP